MPEPTNQPSPLRRVLRRLLTLSLTTVVAGIAIVGGAALFGALSSRASVSDAPPPAPALLVATDRVVVQDSYAITRRFTGQVEAGQKSDLSFEEPGTLSGVAVREGAQVHRGDRLAWLDTRLLEAEMTRLEAGRASLVAQAELARRTNARRQQLLDRGHVSDQAVDDTSLRLAQLRAAIAELDAAIVSVDIRLEKAVVRAPFDGIVGERRMDVGSTVSPGLPVLTLLEDGEARLRVGVDPALAAGLAQGSTATVDVDGVARTVRLTQLAPELDPVTRSRTLFFTFDGDAPPAGTTVDLLLSQTVAAEGAWLPVAALRQGPEGTWQITTVVDGSDGPVAAVEAAEVVAQDGARVFARGTFQNGDRFVTAGSHRVVAGEPVRLMTAPIATAARQSEQTP